MPDQMAYFDWNFPIWAGARTQSKLLFLLGQPSSRARKMANFPSSALYFPIVMGKLREIPGETGSS